MEHGEGLNLVTDWDPGVRILDELGCSLATAVDATEPRVEQLAFAMFDTLLSNHIPPPVPESYEVLVLTMDAHTQELDSMRTKCRLEAARFMDSAEWTAKGRLEDLGNFAERGGCINRSA